VSLTSIAEQPARIDVWAYVQIARIDHWFKNTFMILGVILAVFYEPQVAVWSSVPALIIAVVATCLVASSNYVLNELLDGPNDMLHPEKRRRPVSAPGDRKAANRQYRERQRQDRARRQQGMQRGEQWAMPARDRGAVRALVRDYVDSRRRLSEFYMYGLLVLLVLLFIRNPLVQSIVPVLVTVAVLIMLVEGIFIGRRARALAEKRLPGESTQGVRLYAAMRALQIRQLRMPKPRIKPGDSF